MSEWIGRFLDAHRDEHGDLEPPWAQYPCIRAGSIGWRMGGGESWLGAWFRFVADLDDAELLAYLLRHPPPPMSWQKTLTSVLSKRPPSPEPGLRVQALVQPDAAYPVYVRNEMREGGVCAPWAWSGSDDMAARVKVHIRRLAFWGRWCAAERTEGRLGAWLEGQPPAPEPWRPVIEALRRQIVPAEPHELWLVCSLAAHGEPSPPWTEDAAPPEREIRLRGDFERVDVWWRWVFWTFDDASSYQRYLQRHPPPETWQIRLESWFPWLHGSSQ